MELVITSVLPIEMIEIEERVEILEFTLTGRMDKDRASTAEDNEESS